MKLNQLVSSIVGAVLLITMMGTSLLVPFMLWSNLICGNPLPDVPWYIIVALSVLYAISIAAFLKLGITPKKFVECVKEQKMVYIALALMTVLTLVVYWRDKATKLKVSHPYGEYVKYVDDLEEELAKYKEYYWASEDMLDITLENLKTKDVDSLLQTEWGQHYLQIKWETDSINMSHQMNYKNGEV